MPTVLVSAEEAADYIGVTHAQFAEIVGAGRLAPVDGSFREEDVMALARERQQKLRGGIPGLVEKLRQEGGELGAEAAATIELLASDAMEALTESARLVTADFNGITGGEVVTASPVWGILASMVEGEFERHPDAKNFLSTPMQMSISPAHPRQGFVITIRRQDGKSPGQIIDEKDETIRQLREELAQATGG